jgi:hypothetical protein
MAATRFLTRTAQVLVLCLAIQTESRAASYTNDWSWSFVNGQLLPNTNPLNLNPSSWTGFSPIYIEYVIAEGASKQDDARRGAVVPIIEDWAWVVAANGTAAPIVNPRVLNVAAWTGFEPFIEFVIADGSPYDWSHIEFTQTAGPVSLFGGVATVNKDQLSNCGTSILHARCEPLPDDPNYPPSGVYTIQATVFPSMMVAQAQIVVNNPVSWIQVTFDQISGPVPDVFGPVTVVRGEVSNCESSLLNARCKEIPENPTPGNYVIQAAVTYSSGKTQQTTVSLAADNEGTITIIPPAPPVTAPALGPWSAFLLAGLVVTIGLLAIRRRQAWAGSGAPAEGK